MERSENIRDRELRGRHLLAAVCAQCGHRSWRDVVFLPGRTAEQVDAIQARMICSKCGNRQGNRLHLAEGELALRHGR
jgi:5-methylcytosine-specific restriction endonuclease McrA